MKFKLKQAPVVEAVQLLAPLMAEGKVVANVGDWIVSSPSGTEVLTNERFVAKYESFQ